MRCIDTLLKLYMHALVLMYKARNFYACIMNNSLIAHAYFLKINELIHFLKQEMFFSVQLLMKITVFDLIIILYLIELEL